MSQLGFRPSMFILTIMLALSFLLLPSPTYAQEEVDAGAIDEATIASSSFDDYCNVITMPPDFDGRTLTVFAIGDVYCWDTHGLGITVCLQRHRWYGWETLNNTCASASSFSTYLTATARGCFSGEYTYRMKVNAHVDVQGTRYHKERYGAENQWVCP
jgi:hypothetical protein